jgi:hypothetical protein
MAPPKLSDEERIRLRKESVRKSDLKNKERIKSWRAENKDLLKAYAKEHYAANKEQYIDRANTWKTENRERRAEISSSHKKNNRAYYTADTAKYRADKDKRTPNWLSEFDLLHIKCLYQVAAMRTRESGEPWHVDHVIPLRGKIVSGLHTPANMRVIRGEENEKKNNLYEVQ